MFPIAEKQVFKENHNIAGDNAVVRDVYLNIHSPSSFTSNYSILLSILKAVNLSRPKIYGKNNAHINWTIFPLFLKQHRKVFSSHLYLYGTWYRTFCHLLSTGRNAQLVNIEMGKIVPIYCCAILNTEKNVIKTAGRTETRGRKVHYGIAVCWEGERHLRHFVDKKKREKPGCDKWKKNQM